VEGDFGPELKKQVKELNLDDHVHFTGPLPYDQIRKWLNAADIFCLATSNEGWANVFFEAMGCGKPVVTTRVGGNEEVVKSADYGILVDLDDQKQLKNAIIEALEKKWDHRKIIEYAAENNWEEVARKVLQELRKIVTITNCFSNPQNIRENPKKKITKKTKEEVLNDGSDSKEII